MQGRTRGFCSAPEAQHRVGLPFILADRTSEWTYVHNYKSPGASGPRAGASTITSTLLGIPPSTVYSV